jgi:hypothetical protein
MGRWFFRVTGDEPTLRIVPPQETPPVAVDPPKASTNRASTNMASSKMASAAPDQQSREKIRELLRLEFECAADASLRTGNLIAARILSQLARTTSDVEVNVLCVYAQLLDDITLPPAASDQLRQIGSCWFPQTAAEYVERLSSARLADRASIQKAEE